MTRGSYVLVCSVAWSLGLFCEVAEAEGRGDGVYGRLEGDVALSLGAGYALRSGLDGTYSAFEAEARARYIDAGGIFVAGSVAPRDHSQITFGAEIRPLFPALMLLGLDFHKPFWDLLLQSIGLELGAAWLPGEKVNKARLAWGLGVEVPIWSPHVMTKGLWGRIAVRHVTGLEKDQNHPNGSLNEWTVLFLLLFRTIADTGLEKWEPRT